MIEQTTDTTRITSPGGPRLVVQGACRQVGHTLPASDANEGPRSDLVAGVCASASFLFLFFYTAMHHGATEGTAQRIVIAMAGLAAGAGAAVAVKVATGAIRNTILAVLGVVVLALSAGTVPSHSLFLGVYFLCGGDATIMVLGVVLLGLLWGTVLARLEDPESETIRWTACGIAAVVLLLQVVYDLVLLLDSTTWGHNLGQTLVDEGALAKATFAWVTLVVWGLAIVGLVNALHETSARRTAAAWIAVCRVFMWSLAGLVALAFILALTTEAGRTRGGPPATVILALIHGGMTVLLPMAAGAWLCSRAFRTVLLHVSRWAARRSVTITGPSYARISIPDDADTPSGVQPGTGPCEVAESLKSLKAMREDELITAEDYETKKRELLARI